MDTITLARELGKALQKEEVYTLYHAANGKNDKDEVLQDLIGRFNMKRVEMNREISKAEKDQATLSRLDAEIKDIYKLIMDNPSMNAYNAAKTELDSLLAFINQIIVGSANGQNPDEIEQVEGCGGNCEGCQGCH